MSLRSAAATALHEAFRAHWVPLLEKIGFTLAKPKHVKPGLVVALAVRALDAKRRLEATLWCDSGSGAHLRFRLDAIEPVHGEECSRDVALRWDGRSAIDACAREFLPHESEERLRLAITFLAGAFAANAEQIAIAVPEIASDLRAAAVTASWRDSAARASALWQSRHARGDIDDLHVPGTIVFSGEKLVYVEAEGRRLMFRLPARQLDGSRPITVSGWCKTAAGTRVATKLINGERVWTFDLRGEVVAVHAPLA